MHNPQILFLSLANAVRTHDPALAIYRSHICCNASFIRKILISQKFYLVFQAEKREIKKRREKIDLCSLSCSLVLIAALKGLKINETLNFWGNVNQLNRAGSTF